MLMAFYIWIPVKILKHDKLNFSFDFKLLADLDRQGDIFVLLI